MEENQVVTVPPTQAGSFGLSLSRNPVAVLAEAKKAAQALTDVIGALPKEKKVMMGGEQYIEFDHWQLVGRFYGCSAKVVSTEYTEVGQAKGFVARAVVLDSEGREVSAAEAMCLNDEDKWSERNKYEYVNGKREKAGTVPVPMNQLRSMAQTRACAKALRNVFSWVVVLAGYAPTPAEELTGDEQPDQPARPHIAEAQPKNPQPASGDVISEAQGKRLFAIWREAGKSNEQVLGYLKENYGLSSTRSIKKSDYEAICNWAALKEDAGQGDAQE